MRRLILPLVALAFSACEPMATTWKGREPVPVRSRSAKVPAPDPAPVKLKTMAWNIKYGAGRIDFWFDLWGDRVEMTRDEVEGNLAKIYELINEVKPDLFIAEEIELASRRSAYVDMVGGILENTDLNYAAFVPNWQARYIPNEGLGRMEMGNAIFSRYPIASAERISQSERTDLDAPHWYFYLHRSVGRAVVQVAGKEVAVYAVHTEAYDTDDTKSRQLDELLALAEEEKLPFLLGGDFNALPPTAAKTKGFADDHPSAKGTDFETPPYVLDDMKPFFDRYTSAISLQQYGTTEAEQARYYTHSIIGPDKTGGDGKPGFWTRTLDYLFVNPPDRFAAGSDVLQKAGDSGILSNPLLLSDHAPVVGTWEVLR